MKNDFLKLVMNKEDMEIKELRVYGDDELKLKDLVKKYSSIEYVGINTNGDCVDLTTGDIIKDDDKFKNQLQNIVVTITDFSDENRLIIHCKFNENTKSVMLLSEDYVNENLIESEYTLIGSIIDFISMALQARTLADEPHRFKFKLSEKDPVQLNPNNQLKVDFSNKTITLIKEEK